MHVHLLTGLLLLLFFSALASSASGRPAASWQLKTSPHFSVYHEADWSPDSITLELERLYGKLRMNVSMFAPWMVREKTKVYIYRDQRTYLNGEFHPPKWSKGLAYFSTKTVVVYDSGDIIKLRATLAHELTHLYFESFYGERLKNPPQWLNEGLAVMMEDLSPAGAGHWSSSLRYFPGEKIIPLERFFSVRLDQLDSDAQIGYWYLEAFGVVAYLFRPHMRIQFKNFCSLLRQGEKLEPTLWKVYRIKNLGEFDLTWRNWIRDYGTRQKQEPGGSFPSASFNFKPVEFTPFSLSNKDERKK
ncbi:MAG: hypothetical protein HY796_09205 [Elusimicrobia bacterium]|nr:hypothetical protein [Elusimicrobiota bacterium]